MKNFNTLWIIASSLLLSGCISDYSSTATSNKPSDFETMKAYGNKEYFVLDPDETWYYPPKGLIHIDITSAGGGDSDGTTPPPKKDIAANPSDVSLAGVAPTDGAATNAATADMDTTNAGTAVDGDLKARLAARAQGNQADMERYSAMIQSGGAGPGGPGAAPKPLIWTVKVTPVIEADKDEPPYKLTALENPFFDRHSVVTVDPSTMLLQTVDSTTTDQTVASLGNLIAAAGSVLTFGAALSVPGGMVPESVPQGSGTPAITVKPSDCPPEWHQDYDPDVPFTTDTSKYVTIAQDDGSVLVNLSNDKKKVSTFRIAFAYHGHFKGDGIKNPAPTADELKDAAKDVPGLVVRIPVPYQVTIDEENEDSNTVYRQDQKTLVMLPSTRDFVLPIQSRFLVQDTTNVTLVKGMVGTVQRDRPSMVAAIVGIPKTILGALVPIPLNVRQSQSQNLQAIDNSLKAQSDIKAGQ